MSVKSELVEYVLDYYAGADPVAFAIPGLDRPEVVTAVELLYTRCQTVPRESGSAWEVECDSFDRELVRDLILRGRGIDLEVLEYGADPIVSGTGPQTHPTGGKRYWDQLLNNAPEPQIPPKPASA
jgi:hypothetical protein